MIKEAIFTSVWDGGCAVSTNCKVDTDMHLIVEIETENEVEGLEHLDYEYIVLDGRTYPALNKTEWERNMDRFGFWY